MARSVRSALHIPLLLASLSCGSLTAGAPGPDADRGGPVSPPNHGDPAPRLRPESPFGTTDLLAQTVQIRRTSYGVPHVLAEDLAGAGYGLAWVMMEDYREAVPRAMLQSNGRWGLAVGRDSIQGDFGGRMAHDYAAETYHLLPPDVRAVMDGFARGMNDFARVYRDVLPSWVPDDFTAHDVAARDIGVWSAGAVRAFARSRGPSEGEPSVAERRSGDRLSSWMAWARLEGEEDPEVGSNAWAFAPERTTSGNALLLRNPHLSWTAGYYEAHVRVPGVLDFYGDFRLGGPFTTIGGFNRRWVSRRRTTTRSWTRCTHSFGTRTIRARISSTADPFPWTTARSRSTSLPVTPSARKPAASASPPWAPSSTNPATPSSC